MCDEARQLRVGAPRSTEVDSDGQPVDAADRQGARGSTACSTGAMVSGAQRFGAGLGSVSCGADAFGLLGCAVSGMSVEGRGVFGFKGKTPCNLHLQTSELGKK